MNRFDYVKYDDASADLQKDFKNEFKKLEQLLTLLSEGRPKNIALTKLEEAYAWIGKAIRDDQLKRAPKTSLQEDRTNS